MISFQQIRNATVKLKYPGVTFLVDPWLSEPCSPEEKAEALQTRRFIPKPVCPLTMPPEEVLADVDVILATHLHEDHFSGDFLPTTARMVFQNHADAEKAEAMGFSNAACFADAPLTFGGVTVYRVDARHGDSDALACRMGPTSGFVFVQEGEPTIYLAGDTVYYNGVRDVIARFSPEIIIVNACDARVPAGRLIMNAEDVIRTCACRPDSLVIASHMEAVSHAHLSRTALHHKLSETPYAAQVRIPADGEGIDL